MGLHDQENFKTLRCFQPNLPGGGGGALLYGSYRNVPPQKVRYLRRFGLKTGTDFFGFEETTGVY